MALEKFYQNVITGNILEVEEGVQAALSAGVIHEDIVNLSLISAMDEAGQRFESDDLLCRKF